MKNMKILTTAVLCLLLSFSMGATAMAESITSPDGQSAQYRMRDTF